MKNSGKVQILLGRVNAEICYRNAKVDMNEIKMEMRVSVGTRKNSKMLKKQTKGHCSQQ